MSMTKEQIDQWMRDCTLCPRQCHANRSAGQRGFCGETDCVRAARAALHFWEEPCFSGSAGSGAVFFSGCSLRCIYCQNRSIAFGEQGQTLSLERLSEIFLELQAKGAANLNLVTAGHFLPQVAYSLEQAKRQGLRLPVVYNTGGYEEANSLKLLEGLVDIYLPDLKYRAPETASACANAPDYFAKATAAIAEMFRQTGRPVFDTASGMMRRGVLVRHLVLPGYLGESKRILRYLHGTYGNDIYVSIMNQYTPLRDASLPPPLDRRLLDEEYQKILSFAERIGIEQGFYQDAGTAEECFIPPFDLEGL